MTENANIYQRMLKQLYPPQKRPNLIEKSPLLQNLIKQQQSSVLSQISSKNTTQNRSQKVLALIQQQKHNQTPQML
jgi:hypothetical protein